MKTKGQEISVVVTCPDMIFGWAFPIPHPKSGSGQWSSAYAISLWLPRSATKKSGRSVLMHSECYLGTILQAKAASFTDLILSISPCSIFLSFHMLANDLIEKFRPTISLWKMAMWHSSSSDTPPVFISLSCFPSPVESNVGSLSFSQLQLCCSAFAA